MANQTKTIFKNLPRYIFEYIWGLVLVTLSDFNITSLALAGVFVGLATSSIYIGVATFFVLYSLLRMVNNVSEAIVYGGKVVANSILQKDTP